MYGNNVKHKISVWEYLKLNMIMSICDIVLNFYRSDVRLETTIDSRHRAKLTEFSKNILKQAD